MLNKEVATIMVENRFKKKTKVSVKKQHSK